MRYPLDYVLEQMSLPGQEHCTVGFDPDCQRLRSCWPFSLYRPCSELSVFVILCDRCRLLLVLWECQVGVTGLGSRVVHVAKL